MDAGTLAWLSLRCFIELKPLSAFAVMTNDWSAEETDDLLYADRRNLPLLSTICAL
jgi:hypothetical protein